MENKRVCAACRTHKQEAARKTTHTHIHTHTHTSACVPTDTLPKHELYSFFCLYMNPHYLVAKHVLYIIPWLPFNKKNISAHKVTMHVIQQPLIKVQMFLGTLKMLR